MFVACSFASHYCEFFYAFNLLNIIFNNQLLQRIIKAPIMNDAFQYLSTVSILNLKARGAPAAPCAQACRSLGWRCSVWSSNSSVIMYLFAIVAFMLLKRLMWPVADAYAYCTYAPP